MYIRERCIKTILQGVWKVQRTLKDAEVLRWMVGTAVDSAGGMGYDRKFADTYLQFLQA